LEHVPLVGSHEPAAWQRSCGEHVTLAPPTHVPPMHVSDWVHALPSVHAAPSSSVQVPSLAAPPATVHAPQGLAQAWLQHTPVGLPTQTPLKQTSSAAQGAPRATFGAHVPALHQPRDPQAASVVQAAAPQLVTEAQQNPVPQSLLAHWRSALHGPPGGCSG
jgi:hypothetical protein